MNVKSIRSGETTEPQPVLFENELTTILASTGQSKFLVWAGRGVGKTFLLKQLASRLPFESPTQIIEGTDPDHAYTALEEALEKNDPVLVDDVDNLLLEYLKKTHEDRQKLISVLERLAGQRSTSLGRRTMVFTQTVLLDPAPIGRRMEKPSFERGDQDWWIDSGSILDQQCKRLFMDPWDKGWRKRLEWYIRTVIPDSETTFGTWFDAILELSGGHPSLVAMSLDGLSGSSLSGDNQSITSPLSSMIPHLDKMSVDQRKSYAQQFLLDVFMKRDTGYFERLLVRLRDSEDRSIQDAMDLLSAISQGDKVESPSKSTITLLSRLSLLYYDTYGAEGRYRIPGDWLRMLVQKYTEEFRTVVLLESPDSEQRRQRLQIITPEGTQSLSLSGLSLQIMKVLLENKNEIVTLKMMGDTKSENAVRSALRRLIQKMKAKDLDWLIDNIRGEGYRLNV